MSSRIRVLVMEDDCDLCEALCDALREEGYEVSSVTRGEDAVTLATTTPFDLVVADVRLHGMDGLEALQRMHLHQPDVLSMVITGHCSEEYSIRAVRLGVGEYLKKPFSQSEFLACVSALVKRRVEATTRQEVERGLRRVAVWALEALGGALDEKEAMGLGARLRAGRLAGALARALGLPDDAAADVRMAAVLAAIRMCDDPDSLRGWEAHPKLRTALQNLNEHWDGSGMPDGLAGSEIPLESRVVAVALETSRETEEISLATGERLRSLCPGRFDPRVLEALGSLGVPDPPDPEASSLVRGLLSLGETLAARGDSDSARRAFGQVLRDAPGSREAVAAHHRLAALSAAAGDAETAASLAARAVEEARRLGPMSAAGAGLESAVLLLGVAPQHALRTLEEVLPLAVDLRLEVVASQARLALARLAAVAGSVSPSSDMDEDLAVLLRPENALELSRCAPWLLPLMLERQGDSPTSSLARQVERVARECPGQLQYCLTREALSVRARVAAAAVCGQVGAKALLGELLADPDGDVRHAASAALEEARTDGDVPLLRVCSLGSLDVFRGGERVGESAWKTQKIKFLFAYLVAHNARPVPEDVLIEIFWPGDLEKGKSNLYGATSVLRRALEFDEKAGGRQRANERTGRRDDSGSRGILRTRGELQLYPGISLWHDAEELEKACSEGRRLDGEGRFLEAFDRYRRGGALYRGPYLEGCYMDWALQLRDRLEQAVQMALLRLGEMALESGRTQEALEYSGRLLELDPCHQQAYQVGLQASIQCGRPEEAMRQYERCKRMLAAELGVEPAMKLVELYHRARLAL